MSKPTTREKISFVKSCYGLTIKWGDIVKIQLFPTLEYKKTKKVIVEKNGNMINE